uniref:Microsomal glutathione S-transferase 1 n=1 Tax=Bemisia tabaci TaxID=7038 RepID=A0A6C0MEW7_BEMTA|nr:microsomal glutathione S-transferase 1 [Bemisia tabaci]
MALLSQIYSLDNPVFTAYIFYTSILLLKMLFMVFVIGSQRFKKGIFISEEDKALHPKAKIRHDDPDIERCRRAHQNDLENIPAFILAGALYQLTSPSAWLAIQLFRFGTIARIVHTFVYAIVVIPQPTRAIAFFVSFAITVYMLVQTILYVL